jgi:hypothetical protein
MMSSRAFLIIAFCLIFLILALFYGRPVIQNDGISYYALTASLIEDRDFRLENQYKKFPEVRVIPFPDGHVASYYSCGFALMYAPTILFLDRFPALRETRLYAQNVKFPFSHTLGVFLGSVLYGFFSVLLSYRFLIHQRNQSPLTAFLISLAVFIGTPLIFYTFTVPSFAHAADAFLVTCIFYLAVSRNFLTWHEIRFRNVLLGFFLAFSVLLRNNNIVIVPVVVLGVLYFEKEKRWRTCFEILGGALPILILHIFYNIDQYGKVIATGYDVRVTGQQVQYRFLRLFFILFHPVVGIYPWSPIAILSTIGLILAARKKDPAALLALAIVIVVIISIRFAAIIFPGSTFGQRLLVHLYVFWVFGLAEFFQRFKKPAIVLACLFTIWSFILFNSYYILTGSGANKIMTKEGGSSPIMWLQTANESYQNSNEESLIGFWYENLGARPYPVLIRIL